MELKQIKQIIDLMKSSELSEFAIEEEGFKLKIRRGLTGYPVVAQTSNPPFAPSGTVSEITNGAAQPAIAPATADQETGVTFVKSPMVGTFYRAPSPESKAFADVGTKVVENTPVCIIEAMKIMNEIQAETKGTIVEVLVENGQPVEYGQKLFKVKQG